MNMFNDAEVQLYMSSLHGESPIHNLAFMFHCQCIARGKSDDDAHSTTAEQLGIHLAELAINQGTKFVVMYLNTTTYFAGETLRILVNKMLTRKEMVEVDSCYNVLITNFELHPPCAPYTQLAYEQLMLVEYRNFFGKKILWKYLVDSLKDMVSGNYNYGENAVADYAFKRCLQFCVNVLLADLEVTKKIDDRRPLIALCLNCNQERRSRLRDTTKLLNQIFNTGFDLQAVVIDLAYLVNQMAN